MVELEVLFTYHKNDVVEARVGVWLLNTLPGHGQQEHGGTYLLEPGGSWGQSVFVSNVDGDSARVNFRVSN